MSKSGRPEPAQPLSRREKRRQQWRTFKNVLPDALALARPQARLWAVGLVLMLVNRLAGLVLPGAPKFLMDRAIPERNIDLFYLIIGLVLGATLIQGLTNFALTQTISKAGQRLIAQLRIRVHHHVTRLSTQYFDNHKTGEVVSRVMDDVEGVRNLLGTGMVELMGGIMTAAFALVILFWLNWQMTLAIFVCLGLFLVVLIKAFTTLRPLFKKRQEARAGIAGRLTESIAGIRVVKAYNTEGIERTEFGRGVDRLLRELLNTINAISMVALTSSILLGVLGATILFIGGRQLMAEQFTPGEFVSYILYLGFMIAPLSSIMMIGTNLSEVFAGLERIKEIMSEKVEDSDEEQKAPLPEVRGFVTFEGISFEYEAGKPVLHQVSFTAEPGTVTAIVGPSGSGKSTLIGLIASFYRPLAGRIMVDGRDLAGVRLSDFRRHLGVVLQDNFLFDGTIRENILYARPDATEEAVHEAARLAHCEEFVLQFPDGYDTIIGERGVKLSGGQRQRVAIARALLANPRVLILDEATSALDSESEAAIQDGLALLMEGRTTFVIAHRLSTIRHANQILVLESGRIIERGTHGDLLEKRGRYHDMYTRQHGVEENLFLAPGEFRAEASADEVEQPEEDAAAKRKKRAEKLSRLLSGE